MVFASLLRRLEIPAVPHGFRTSFRNWVAECTPAPWEVGEAALAHNVGNSTEAVYMRSDLFEQRRALMDRWAAYVARGTDKEEKRPMAEPTRRGWRKTIDDPVMYRVIDDVLNEKVSIAPDFANLPRRWREAPAEASGSKHPGGTTREELLANYVTLAPTQPHALEGLQRLYLELTTNGEPIPPLLSWWNDCLRVLGDPPPKLGRPRKLDRDGRILTLFRWLGTLGFTREAAIDILADRTHYSANNIRSIVRQYRISLRPQGAAEASRLDGREGSGRSIQDSGGDDSAGNCGDAEDVDADLASESSDEGRASARRQAAEDAGRAKAVNGNKAEAQDEQKADSAEARKQEAQISSDREDADFLKNFLPFDVGGTNPPDLSLETAETDPGEGEKGQGQGPAGHG